MAVSLGDIQMFLVFYRGASAIVHFLLPGEFERFAQSRLKSLEELLPDLLSLKLFPKIRGRALAKQLKSHSIQALLSLYRQSQSASKIKRAVKSIM